jgi:hypothetical protein
MSSGCIGSLWRGGESSFNVGDHGAIDDVRQVSFEDAQAAFGGVTAGLPTAFQELADTGMASALSEGDAVDGRISLEALRGRLQRTCL